MKLYTVYMQIVITAQYKLFSNQHIFK